MIVQFQGRVVDMRSFERDGGKVVNYIYLHQPGERQLARVRLKNGVAFEVGDEVTLRCRLIAYKNKREQVDVLLLEV